MKDGERMKGSSKEQKIKKWFARRWTGESGCRGSGLGSGSLFNRAECLNGLIMWTDCKDSAVE